MLFFLSFFVGVTYFESDWVLEDVSIYLSFIEKSMRWDLRVAFILHVNCICDCSGYCEASFILL